MTSRALYRPLERGLKGSVREKKGRLQGRFGSPEDAPDGGEPT